jgi:hypothetical protein
VSAARRALRPAAPARAGSHTPPRRLGSPGGPGALRAHWRRRRHHGARRRRRRRAPGDLGAESALGEPARQTAPRVGKAPGVGKCLIERRASVQGAPPPARPTSPPAPDPSTAATTARATCSLPASGRTRTRTADPRRGLMGTAWGAGQLSAPERPLPSPTGACARSACVALRAGRAERADAHRGEPWPFGPVRRRRVDIALAAWINHRATTTERPWGGVSMFVARTPRSGRAGVRVRRLVQEDRAAASSP